MIMRRLLLTFVMLALLTPFLNAGSPVSVTKGGYTVTLLSNTDECLSECQSIYKVCSSSPVISVETRFIDKNGGARNVDNSLLKKIGAYTNERVDMRTIDYEGLSLAIAERDAVRDAMEGEAGKTEDPKEGVIKSNETLKTDEELLEEYTTRYTELKPVLIFVDAPLPQYHDAGCFEYILKGTKNIADDIDNIPVINGVSFPEFTWWNTSWVNYQLITINSSQIYGTNYNFTFPVILNSSNINMADVRDDCGDIRFIDYDNTTELSYEMEFCNATSAVFWVKKPQLDSSNNKVYMYYNNTLATTTSNARNAWNPNFIAIFHMNETSGTLKESLSNWYYSGTPNSLTAQGSLALGGIGGAIDTGAAAGYVFTNITATTFNPETFTVEALAISGTWSAGTERGLATKYYAGSGSRSWSLENGVGANKLHMYVGSNDALGFGYTGKTDDTTNWHYYVGGYNGTGTAYDIFVGMDNALNNSYSASRTSALATNAANVSIGGITKAATSASNLWNGKIDEVRLSNVRRNGTWLNTTYNSLRTIGFMSYSPVEYAPVSPPSSNITYNSSISALEFSTIRVNASLAGNNTITSMYGVLEYRGVNHTMTTSINDDNGTWYADISIPVYQGPSYIHHDTAGNQIIWQWFYVPSQINATNFTYWTSGVNANSCDYVAEVFLYGDEGVPYANRIIKCDKTNTCNAETMQSCINTSGWVIPAGWHSVYIYSSTADGYIEKASASTSGLYDNVLEQANPASAINGNTKYSWNLNNGYYAYYYEDAYRPFYLYLNYTIDGVIYGSTKTGYVNNTRRYAANQLTNITGQDGLFNQAYAPALSTAIADSWGAYLLPQRTANTSETWGFGDWYNPLDMGTSYTFTNTNVNNRKYIRGFSVPYGKLDGYPRFNTANRTNTSIFQAKFCDGIIDTYSTSYCGPCTTTGCLKQVLNFDIRDIINATPLSAAQAALFSISAPISSTQNYSKTSAVNATYYVYPSSLNLTVSSSESYTATGYFSNLYQLLSLDISENYNVTRYLTPSSSGSYVSVFVYYAGTYQRAPNVVVIPRYYDIGTGTTREAGISSTNADGFTSFLLKVDSTYYNWAVYDTSGNQLFVDSGYSIITCGSAGCSKSIYLTGGDLGVTLYGSEYFNCFTLADKVRCQYDNPDFTASTLNITVYNQSNTSQVLCSNQALVSNGIIECAVTLQNSYIANFSIDGTLATSWKNYFTDVSTPKYGTDVFMYVGLIIIVLAMIFSYNQILSIIMMVFGVLLMTMTGAIPSMYLTYLVGLGIFAILLISFLRGSR